MDDLAHLYLPGCDVCELSLAHRDELGGRCAVLKRDSVAALGALVLRERPLLRWCTDEPQFSALGADANMWFAYAAAVDRLGSGGSIDCDLDTESEADSGDRRRTRALLNACAWVRGDRFDRFVELARRASQLRVLPRLSEELKVRLLLISDTNAHACGSDSAAIFPMGCKVAHSCRANVAYRFVAGALQYRVVRPLRGGDALTFNYLGENVCRDARSRSALLQLTKRFTCRCELCCEPDRLRALPCERECAPGAVMIYDPHTQLWLCEACRAQWSDAQLAETALARERTAVSLFEKQEDWYSSVTQRLVAAARAERLVGALHWAVAMQHRKVMRNILQLEANRASEQQGLSANEVRDRYAPVCKPSAEAVDHDDDDYGYAAYVALMNGDGGEDDDDRDDYGSTVSFDSADEAQRLRVDDGGEDEPEVTIENGVPLSGEALLNKAADSGMRWVAWAMHCDSHGTLATTAATAMQELQPLLERVGRSAEAERVRRHFAAFHSVEWLQGEEDDVDNSSHRDECR
jgi:hypothetical protein